MAPETFADQKLARFSTQELLAGPAGREFIIVAGKDGVGKTCCLVAVASYVEMVLNPDARFYVIDLEHKFISALRSFGAQAPDNLVYLPVQDGPQVVAALGEVLEEYRPGDWVALDSIGKFWERAQDMGYRAITEAGEDKATYMKRRQQWIREHPKVKCPLPVTPQPADLWSIIKGMYDGQFMDRLTNTEDLNVIMTTPVGRPPKEQANRQESADRVEMRAEFGIDMNIEGAPRTPYAPETLVMLGLQRGKGTMQVVRDNLSALEEPRVAFKVGSRFDWGSAFWENCR